MTDYNILNRGSFDDKRKTYEVQIQPFIVEGGASFNLGGPNNVLWVKQVSWKYEYIDVGVPNARRVHPIEKIVVSVEGGTEPILDAVDRALPPFTEPQPIVGQIYFRVRNTNLANNHKLVVKFFVDGVLVKPRDGIDPPTLKQMKAYIMMDSSDRGKLAMEEAAADQLDETLTQMGFGSLRDSLPGGMAALKQLPPMMQNAVIQGLVAKGELPEFMAASVMMPALGMGGGVTAAPLALPDADPEKETSAFLGDLLATCPEECQEMLKTSHLKHIAAAMVERGWRRI
jgi:hypothetical protein